MQKTILYLEDAPDLQQLVRRILSNDGHKVVGACTPKEAYATLDQGLVPNVILMDLSIPDMEPFDFIYNLDSRFPHLKIPIVVASGHNDASKIARSLGAVATLQKPFRIDELSRTIATVLYNEDKKPALPSSKPHAQEAET